MIRALIFDLDNTLVKTDKANALAYVKACKAFGFKVSESEFLKHFRNHVNWKVFLPRVTGSKDAKLIEKIHDLKTKVYPEFFGKVEKNERLFGIIGFFEKHDAGVKLCIATSASKKSALPLLKNAGLAGKMDAVVYADDVSKLKPNPEIFLKAAKKLGVKPVECVVFEDSKAGIEAAKKAGMHCVKIEF